MDKNSRPFFGGVPTDIDIKRLRDEYPESEMRAGDRITYSDVESIISCNRNSHRFRTITNRWRGMIERETGIRIAAFNGEYFKVLSDPEKLKFIEDKKKSVLKQARKNLVRTAYVDRNKLSEDEKKRLDHEVINSKNLIASQQLRNINADLPSMIASGEK